MFRGVGQYVETSSSSEEDSQDYIMHYIPYISQILIEHCSKINITEHALVIEQKIHDQDLGSKLAE